MCIPNRAPVSQNLYQLNEIHANFLNWFASYVTLQSGLMEQRGEEKMVHKFLQVIKFLNTFFSEEMTLR